MDRREDSVTGRVKSIFFQNPTNFFKILLIDITGTTITWTEPDIVVTGTFGDIKEDETYTFTGHVIDHPKYGQQFQADNYHVDRPTNKTGLINYLSSDKFPGIGPKTAEKIIDKLGVDAINQILDDPASLEGLGITAAKRKMLVDNLKTNQGMERVIIGLNDYGFTSNMAGRIYQQYKNDALEVIKQNPYQLINDIAGIGFTRADQIAAKLNIAPDSQLRLGGAVMDTLQRLTDGEGDTFVELRTLVTQTLDLLERARNIAVKPDAVGQAIVTLAKDNALVAEGKRIFPKQLYDSEWQIARQLKGLAEAGAKAEEPELPDIEKTLAAVQADTGIAYDEVQKKAIVTALRSPIFLLTGGPGTGKTTVTDGIVRTYARLHDLSLDANQYDLDDPFPIMLAAPTGRAAKRISETTQLPASTIHRLLGLGVDTQDFAPNDLPDGLLIIDEMSMVDTYLFRTLLTALHPGMQIVLVGDKDQLPSVGPGQVFADLLRSGALPQAALTHVHRQDADSSIIPLAHAVNAGKLPDDFTQPQVDRSFLACTPSQVPEVVGQVVKRAAVKQFSIADIQVLAPMYRGTAGIDRLNPMLQNILNPKHSARTKTVHFGEIEYRIGDKILQLVNDPNQNVFNGEIGQIVGITLAKEAASKSDELTIDFDGNEITYKRSDFSKITLAYATSIHKAQGSEFPMVILPLTLQSRRMLRRNLLYTAITRAKSFLILVGELAAFETAVGEVAVNRHTGLVQRLQQVFDMPGSQTTEESALSPSPLPLQSTQIDTNGSDSDNKVRSAKTALHQLTPALAASQKIDPMIGMDGITPQMFMTKEN
ncbi:DNA helicase RecD [Lacticaseibacillus chiayiensis]|uniref:ATP-dependent RecD2 DNA helicase n=1 Tax=Lacticaseibacillus chiayiensis TaxID=2100821 RepID=A0A4Q1UE59_9LACO|nr:ATP-dependent RecD-like DNA helicase [Lacticaseibacillus chiayiensis]QVI35768.1 ATP-dependent RecD-like DNA helicase [Lacticaseibacillus chiayiensis]RXT30259.1 DNA helicase RecD [Lacticaseibacillus chiayiensis]UYN57604.1 ATP-dependent RecD-like DNA helicase [Lacticaseibacillus chiayiensis]